MANAKIDLLNKLVKSQEIFIERMEDDSSSLTKNCKVFLAKTISHIGSQVVALAEGQVQPVGIQNATHLYVNGDLEKVMSGEETDSDLAKFVEGLEPNPDGDGFIYKGILKLDVSKPKVRSVNGKPQVTNPANLWLVSVNFNRRRGDLLQQQRADQANATAAFFSGLLNAAGAGATNIGKASTPVEQES